MSGEEASTSGGGAPGGDAEARQRLAEKYGARDAHLTFTKEQLERMVDRVLDSNETVKYLMESLRLGGCPVGRNFFQARAPFFLSRALCRPLCARSRAGCTPPIAGGGARRSPAAAPAAPPPARASVRRREHGRRRSSPRPRLPFSPSPRPPRPMPLTAAIAPRRRPPSAPPLAPRAPRAGGAVHAGRRRRLLDGPRRHPLLQPPLPLQAGGAGDGA